MNKTSKFHCKKQDLLQNNVNSNAVTPSVYEARIL